MGKVSDLLGMMSPEDKEALKALLQDKPKPPKKQLKSKPVEKEKAKDEHFYQEHPFNKIDFTNQDLKTVGDMPIPREHRDRIYCVSCKRFLIFCEPYFHAKAHHKHRDYIFYWPPEVTIVQVSAKKRAKQREKVYSPKVQSILEALNDL